MDRYYERTKPRILEYCGRHSDHPSGWDSEFLVCGTERDTRFRFVDNEALADILDIGADVYRSLWSRQGSLFFLDLEFKSTRDEEEIYWNGPQIFRTSLEPVYRDLCDILQAFNISFITVMTATGYHFVFAVRFESWAHHRLVRLGNPCPELCKQYARVYPVGHRRRPVPVECALAFDGMGRVAEFLTQKMAPVADIPVDAGIQHPRQVLLDLSTYADPLHFRFLRCVGSYHQKSARCRYATPIRRRATDHSQALDDILAMIGSPDVAAEYIHSTPATIPEAGKGLHELLSSYEGSELHRRHREFDAYRPKAEETRLARNLLLEFTDRELASDLGIKRAVLRGCGEGIHPRPLGSMVAERLRLAAWDSPIMAWANEREDGYNPYSRALFWARLYAS